MTVYTSYFGNINNIPKGIIPIAICGKSPNGWTGFEYKRLAPKWSFFKVWKETHDNQYYIDNFYALVLNKLNQDSVMRELEMISGGQDICLLCYETPDKFCHRHLVAGWLSSAGYEARELL